MHRREKKEVCPVKTMYRMTERTLRTHEAAIALERSRCPRVGVYSDQEVLRCMDEYREQSRLVQRRIQQTEQTLQKARYLADVSTSRAACGAWWCHATGAPTLINGRTHLVCNVWPHFADVPAHFYDEPLMVFGIQQCSLGAIFSPVRYLGKG